MATWVGLGAMRLTAAVVVAVVVAAAAVVAHVDADWQIRANWRVSWWRWALGSPVGSFSSAPYF